MREEILKLIEKIDFSDLAYHYKGQNVDANFNNFDNAIKNEKI